MPQLQIRRRATGLRSLRHICLPRPALPRTALLCAALAIAGMLAGGTAQAQPVQALVVISAHGLQRALETAPPGTEITLAGGDYGVLQLRDYGGPAREANPAGRGGQADTPVILRSADPENPARFSGLALRGVAHLTLEGLQFRYRFAPGDKGHTSPFQVRDSTGITIRGNLFEGDLAPGPRPEMAGYPTGSGLALRSVTHSVVEDNEIRRFHRALIVSRSDHILVRHNDIHTIRMDGMNFAQVSDVRIEDNHVHDFIRSVASGDHADLLQFWTSRTTEPSRNIVIRGNILNSGNGLYTQSVFMRNEMVDSGRAGEEMFYRNITIEENVIINAHTHGITVGETRGLTIRNNSVIRNARSQGLRDNPSLWDPRIRVARDSADVRVERNVVRDISGYDGQKDWTVRDNLMIQDRFPSRPLFYDKVFVAARTGDPADLASFAPRPGGPLDGKDLGAPQLATPALVARAARHPAILARTAPGDARTFRFALTGPGAGLAETAQVMWDFGDGRQAEGATADHSYARDGAYTVSARITVPDMPPLHASTPVRAGVSEVLTFSAQTGAFTSYAGAQALEVARPTEEKAPAEQAEQSVSDGTQSPAQRRTSGDKSAAAGQAAAQPAASAPPEATQEEAPLPVPGPLLLGPQAPSVAIAPALIAPLFQATDFSLRLRLRATPGGNRTGDLLQIYRTLGVTVQERGILVIRFRTADGPEQSFSTKPLPFARGDWTDLDFAYSAQTGRFTVTADGQIAGEGHYKGPLQPLAQAGLALGNPFTPKESFSAEVSTLTLSVNTAP